MHQAFIIIVDYSNGDVLTNQDWYDSHYIGEGVQFSLQTLQHQTCTEYDAMKWDSFDCGILGILRDVHL